MGKNVLAAGGCEMQRMGRHVRLVQPELIVDPSANLIPVPVRLFLRRFGKVAEFVRMRASDQPAYSPLRSPYDFVGDPASHGEVGREGRLPHVEGVRHRTVETSRLRVHVAEAGSGEPVLLVHGWPQHWYAWRRVIPLLAQRYHVVCPDLRGFGWSEATRHGYSTTELVDDLLALLDALALERVFVVGHDLGGRIGFHLSLRAPARVYGHLALNAMHPYWSARRMLPRAWREWWTPFVETPLLGRLVLRRVPAFMRLWFRLGSPFRETRSAVAVDEFIGALRDPLRARAAERVQNHFAYRELVPTLLGKYRSSRLTVPTLMLNGSKDFALAPAELGGYERYADRLEVEIVTAGHFLPEEAASLVADAAASFFSRLVGSTPRLTHGADPPSGVLAGRWARSRTISEQRFLRLVPGPDLHDPTGVGAGD